MGGFSGLVQTELDDADGNFFIDRRTGELRVAPSADLDTPLVPNFQLSVRVTDAAGVSEIVTVTVSVR